MLLVPMLTATIMEVLVRAGLDNLAIIVEVKHRRRVQQTLADNVVARSLHPVRESFPVVAVATDSPAMHIGSIVPFFHHLAHAPTPTKVSPSLSKVATAPTRTALICSSSCCPSSRITCSPRFKP